MVIWLIYEISDQASHTYRHEINDKYAKRGGEEIWSEKRERMGHGKCLHEVPGLLESASMRASLIVLVPLEVLA
jgi:hypothetical protein